MDMTDVRMLYRRGNRLLFNRNSACLQPLLADFRRESRTALVCWALARAERPVALLASRYPKDGRPMDALRLSRLWAEGKLKMPLPGRLYCRYTRWPGKYSPLPTRPCVTPWDRDAPPSTRKITPSALPCTS